MRIMLFGPTRVMTESGTIAGSELGGIKPRQILEILALANGTPVPKDRLADLLWKGEPPSSYVGTLESYVCVLRRRLGSGGGRDAVIRTTPAGYQLDTNRVTVDLGECHELLTRATHESPREAVALTSRALELSVLPLLAGESYADWAEIERGRLTRALVKGCIRASRLACEGGDRDTSIELARRAMELDKCDEAAVHQYMQVLWAAGRRAAAMRAYVDLRHELLDELAVEPGHETHSLYLQILMDENATAGSEAVSHGELRGLLDLLRDALERTPGVEPTRGDSGLSFVAVKALSLA